MAILASSIILDRRFRVIAPGLHARQAKPVQRQSDSLFASVCQIFLNNVDRFVKINSLTGDPELGVTILDSERIHFN